MLPWEYMPAEKGTYQAGQLLAADATTGHLEAIAADLTTTPPYLCMADITVETAGTPIPVTRVSRACIYETTLSGAATGAVVGTKLQVESGGLQASKPGYRAAAPLRWCSCPARQTATPCGAAG